MIPFLKETAQQLLDSGRDLKDLRRTIFYQVPGGIDPATRLDARGSDY